MKLVRQFPKRVVLVILVAAAFLTASGAAVCTAVANPDATSGFGGGRTAATSHAAADFYRHRICEPLFGRPTDPPSSDAAAVYSYRIVNTYPHDPSAFTQGLVWESGSLYEGTGLNGRSGLRQVDLTTGQVLQSTPLAAEYFGEGVTVFGDRALQLTWRSNVGFIYARASLTPLGQFTYPTEGWGLTQDGDSLIMSDGTSTLHFLDPQTFVEIRTIDVHDRGVAVSRLNELEYVRGEIWANVWLTDRIARISPVSGQVMAWIDLTGLRPRPTLGDPDAVLNGIAYDPASDRIFVTGKLWPGLYEIDLVPPVPKCTSFKKSSAGLAAG